MEYLQSENQINEDKRNKDLINEIINSTKGKKLTLFEEFRTQYEMFSKSLHQSFLREEKLVKKCREMATALAMNASTFQMALKKQQENEETIEFYKQQSELAWKEVTIARSKESEALHLIKDLKEEMKTLKNELQKLANVTGIPNTKNNHKLNNINDELKNNCSNILFKSHDVNIKQKNFNLPELEEWKKVNNIWPIQSKENTYDSFEMRKQKSNSKLCNLNHSIYERENRYLNDIKPLTPMQRVSQSRSQNDLFSDIKKKKPKSSYGLRALPSVE